MFTCVYPARNGDPCGKPGTNFPPLCRKHERYRDELDDESDLFSGMIEGLFSRPEIKRVLDRVNHIIDKATIYIDEPERLRRLVDEPTAWRPPQARPTSTTSKPPREDPRVVLGFEPTAKLTAAIIKTRKKDLARLWHPDHGGSEEAMKRLNTATDALLKGL